MMILQGRERLCGTQGVDEQMSISSRIARPPEAWSLPLNLRNVGMSHWQLSYRLIAVGSARGRGTRCQFGALFDRSHFDG